MIKSALQKFHMKLNTTLNGRKVKNKILNESLQRKVLIDFLKLFKEETVLTSSAGSLFQSARAAAAKKQAPSVDSIFCIGGSSRVLDP